MHRWAIASFYPEAKMKNELIPEYSDMSGALDVGLVGQESILWELDEDEIEEFKKAHKRKLQKRQKFQTGFQLPEPKKKRR